MDVVIVVGDTAIAYEYFCPSCGQMRLSFVKEAKCANCGGVDIIKGDVGTLDLETLFAKYQKDKG